MAAPAVTVPEHVDVLVVGAGVSGIGAAYHLGRRHPGRSVALLEARGALGGTWDLFRYPGIRSDSDLHTFGFAFKPWRDERAIAGGPSILAYLQETAREHGIERRIRFHHRVLGASWSGDTARWTVDVERTDTGEALQLTTSWLFSACGYYRYDRGFEPPLPGAEHFQGRLVHPQRWPEDLDHAGRRVLVIGSGATAITLVPAMAQTAAHVTMLQRSPSYVLSLPSRDPLAAVLSRLLGDRRGYALTRRKNVWLQSTVYGLARRRPRLVRRVLTALAARQLPPGYAVDPHFTPRYDPWDQRLCIAPDGDLFKAISAGRASVVTDTIETVTERGVRLASGTELEADVLVLATGLELLAFGGLALTVDGRPVDLPSTLAYKGAMLSGVPNFAFAVGYVNASWTLKVDLVCEWLCRVLAHMDARGAAVALPVPADPPGPTRPLLDFSAGYVQRALERFPKQGDRPPWRIAMSYAEDVAVLRDGEVDDGVLQFASAAISQFRHVS
jgi:cation diffusion facilitator CzcD-associated flavoprotein CzcO